MPKNEKPIIFNSEMVRAILEGRKTQTRRPIKPQPVQWHVSELPKDKKSKESAIANGVKIGDISWSQKGGYAISTEAFIKTCPFGQVGGRLWVKETFYVESDEYDCCGDGVHYKADANNNFKWKPSIHMLREFSRITLEIKNIRVERVQEISEEDAIKEGLSSYCNFGDNIHHISNGCDCIRDRFSSLWNSIYGNWVSNPYVWVIDFKRVE